MVTTFGSITSKIDAVTKISEDRIAMRGIQQPPKSVKIELTARCNYRCKFCAVRTRESQPDKDMDIEFFRAITRDMRYSGVEEIGLFYLGEPFCAPELLIQAAEWCKKDMEFPWVFLTSNGSLAKPEYVDRVMKAGVDSIKWSINFGDEDQFKEISGVSEQNMKKAFANIREAYQIRHVNSYKTTLSASSILYEGEQLNRMKETLEKNIIPYVDKHYWLPLYQMSMYADKIKGELGYTPTAGNCGRIDETTMQPTRYPLPCWCAFTEGHVRVDGGLSACGFGADSKFDMGMLDGTNFMKAWNSEKFVALRKAQLDTLTKGQVALSGTPCEVCVAY